MYHVRHEKPIPLSKIGSMDQTPVYFEICLNKTVAPKGEMSVTVHTTGAEKRHLTAVLSCSVSGALLPTMIIFNRQREIENVVPRERVDEREAATQDL